MFSRLSAAFLLAAAVTPPAGPRTPISPALAEAFARKLDSLGQTEVKRGKTPPSVLVTEGELNSYVNYTLAPSLPAGLSDVELQLDRDRVQATGQVDMELVKEHLGNLSPWNPISLLGGRVPILLAGRYLGAKDGFGRVEIEEVRAAGVPIPLSVVEQVVAGATRSRSQPEGFDIHAPFRLPRPVRRVRLAPGQAFLDL
jgi:hypothetical protein